MTGFTYAAWAFLAPFPSVNRQKILTFKSAAD
jgi:hypothetical protein